MPDTLRTPPRIDALARALASQDVRHVVFGSAGALLHGADLAPGDLDICPALDERNLERLARALTHLDARPRVIEGWMTEKASCAWTPAPLRLAQFDHLFETRFGDLDVVPYPYGPNGSSDRFDFDRLDADASSVSVAGVLVRVASIDDLIASKMSRRRDKDITALPALSRLLDDRGR
jgi:hypothetical protein